MIVAFFGDKVWYLHFLRREYDEGRNQFMVSQNAIPSKRYLGGHLHYVFTEQGIANISS